VFAEGGIVENEVRAVLFDGADIAMSFVNWQDPDGHGDIRLRRGTLGETRLTSQSYLHAELRGLSQPLAQSTLEVFSPNCRADLGDHRCTFPIEPPESIGSNGRSHPPVGCLVAPPAHRVLFKRSRSGTAEVVVVLEVVRQLVHLDRAEAGFAHQLLCLLAPPHGAEPLAVLGERDGHAMHCMISCREECPRGARG
jgi:hypothetical protein